MVSPLNAPSPTHRMTVDPYPALPLILIDAGLRGALIALLLLLAAVLLRDRPRLTAARVCILLSAGLSLQALSSTPLFEAELPALWQAPLVGVSVANALLFWLFVQALFDDDFVLRRWHAAAWAAVAALAAWNCAGLLPASLAPLTVGVQRAVPFVFSVLAALAAASHWRADLVEGRRRLRAFIVVSGIAYTLLMLATRLASPHGRLSATASTVDVILLLAIMAVSAYGNLRLGGSELFPGAPGTPAAPALMGPTAPAATVAPAPPDAAEDRLADALQRLMSVDRAYRSEDLSVASLAARLAVPEYRLRRLINQRLGHRNFNAYVNGLRLDEALQVLADPGQREQPVLTIALEAGFQSIGPFNRAFKAATGLTPTEFRRQKLADS